MTAIITPFHDDGSIDFPAFEKLIEFQINSEIDGIIVCGSTGEAATLSDDEQTELIQFAVKTSQKRTIIVGGASSNNTAHAVKRAEIVSNLGVDAILSTSPYYNKPSQAGIVEHYKAQSKVSRVPIIAYNVPGRTGSNILWETSVKLQQIPNILGVKEASGNVLQVMMLLKNRTRPDFYVWIGEDSHTVPMMAMGADGVISVLSNEIPKAFTEITHLALSGDFKAASNQFYQFLELSEANFLDSNPIPVKYILSKMGYCKENYRLPLVATSQEKKNQLDQIAAKLNLY